MAAPAKFPNLDRSDIPLVMMDYRMRRQQQWQAVNVGLIQGAEPETAHLEDMVPALLAAQLPQRAAIPPMGDSRVRWELRSRVYRGREE
jgi:hypothetical protein